MQNRYIIDAWHDVDYDFSEAEGGPLATVGLEFSSRVTTDKIRAVLKFIQNELEMDAIPVFEDNMVKVKFQGDDDIEADARDYQDYICDEVTKFLDSAETEPAGIDEAKRYLRKKGYRIIKESTTPKIYIGTEAVGYHDGIDVYTAPIIANADITVVREELAEMYEIDPNDIPFADAVEDGYKGPIIFRN